jgi:hypothetical protein
MVTVQLLFVVGLVREDVAVKVTVMTDTSVSKLVLIANVLFASETVSHDGFVITTPFFLYSIVKVSVWQFSPEVSKESVNVV